MVILDSLVDETLVCFLTYLPVQDVGRIACGNRRFLTIGQSEPVWCALCEHLWKGKALPSKFILLRDAGHAREAYRQSLLDSKRTDICMEELCSIQWSFRFKAAAGDGWQESDPWWQGQSATQARFSPSGVIRFQRGGVLGQDPPKLRWRFVHFRDGFLNELDQQRVTVEGFESFSGFGRRGVCAKVMGREVPAYCMRRHKGNWGWVMESCWVVWSSWPMPVRSSDEAWELDDDRLPVNFESQRQQADRFNMGFVSSSVDFMDDTEPDIEGNYAVIQYGERSSAAQEVFSPEEDDEGPEPDAEALDGNESIILVLDNFHFRIPRRVVQGMPIEMLEALLRSRIEEHERTEAIDHHPPPADVGPSRMDPASYGLHHPARNVQSADSGAVEEHQMNSETEMQETASD